MSRRAWMNFATISVLWGIPYLFIKIAVDDGMPPAFLAWARVTLGALVLVVLAWRAGTLGGIRGHWRAIAAYAVLEICIPFPFLAAGEQHVASSLAAIVIASVPLIVALLALRFDRAERASGSRLVGLLVGFAGVVALVGIDVGGHRDELLGTAAIFVAAVGYAAGPMILKRHLTDVDPRALMAASFAVAALVLTPFAAIAPPKHAPSGAAIASVVVLGLVCTAAAFVLMASLVGEVGPGRALVITYVNPVIAVGLGVAVLGERPGVGAVAGLLLILAGSWLSTGGRLPPGLGRRTRTVAVAVGPSSLVLIVAGGLASPSPARAATMRWSAPATLARTGVSDETDVRATITPSGRVVAAWTNFAAGGGGRLVMAIGDRRGRFGAPQALSNTATDTPSLAAGHDGSVVIAFASGGFVRVARLRPGATRPDRAVVVAGRRYPKAEPFDAAELVAAPGGGYVLAARVTGGGVLRLDRAGRKVARLPIVSTPAARWVRGGALGVDARGDVATLDPSGDKLVLRRLRAGAGVPEAPVIVAPDAADARLTVAPSGRLAVAYLEPRLGGDAGVSGVPVLASGSARGGALRSVRARAAAPRRSFEPQPLVLGTSPVLVWDEKPEPRAFSQTGIVRSLRTAGRARVTSADDVTEPQAAFLDGRFGLVVGVRESRRWAAGLVGPDGRGRPVAGPGGRPAPYHTATTNRDVASSGSRAVVVWAETRRLGASVATLRP